MSRHTLHSEENFWPCVSDMFLALFVIALLMYSQVSKKKGDGDLLIADQAAAVAIELIEELHTALPEDDHITKAFNRKKEINEESEEKKQDRPKLTEAVNELTQFAARDHTDNNEKAGQPKKYTDAICNLYREACGDGKELDYTADEQLRRAKTALVKCHVTKIPTGVSPEKLEELLIEAQQRNLSLEKENHRLSDRIRALEDKLKNQEELEEQIKNLKQQLERTGSTDIGVLIAENEDLKKKLAEIKNKDIRALVMSQVEEKVEKYGLQGKVKLENTLGVLRIPSDSVGFEQNEDEVSHGREVLRQLSAMLVDIANENTRNKQIDNIVIECHADTKGDAWFNEELSSGRALNVWRELNNNSKQQLQKFKNSQGLGLFSHAGFGARVQLPQLPNEKKQDWWKRCRRIDIRFNCTPMGSDSDTNNSL